MGANYTMAGWKLGAPGLPDPFVTDDGSAAATYAMLSQMGGEPLPPGVAGARGPAPRVAGALAPQPTVAANQPSAQPVPHMAVGGFDGGTGIGDRVASLGEGIAGGVIGQFLASGAKMPEKADYPDWAPPSRRPLGALWDEAASANKPEAIDRKEILLKLGLGLLAAGPDKAFFQALGEAGSQTKDWYDKKKASLKSEAEHAAERRFKLDTGQQDIERSDYTDQYTKGALAEFNYNNDYDWRKFKTEQPRVQQIGGDIFGFMPGQAKNLGPASRGSTGTGVSFEEWSRMTPEQQKAYAAFRAAGRKPANTERRSQVQKLIDKLQYGKADYSTSPAEQAARLDALRAELRALEEDDGE
jgi:hypothetical protein